MSVTNTSPSVALFEDERSIAMVAVLAALLVAIGGVGSVGLSQYMFHSADDSGSLSETTEKIAGGLGTALGSAQVGLLAVGGCAASAPACAVAVGAGVGAIF